MVKEFMAIILCCKANKISHSQLLFIQERGKESCLLDQRI